MRQLWVAWEKIIASNDKHRIKSTAAGSFTIFGITYFIKQNKRMLKKIFSKNTTLDGDARNLLTTLSSHSWGSFFASNWCDEEDSNFRLKPGPKDVERVWIHTLSTCEIMFTCGRGVNNFLVTKRLVPKYVRSLRVWNLRLWSTKGTHVHKKIHTIKKIFCSWTKDHWTYSNLW